VFDTAETSIELEDEREPGRRGAWPEESSPFPRTVGFEVRGIGSVLSFSAYDLVMSGDPKATCVGPKMEMARALVRSMVRRRATDLRLEG
jgi:hypothetical protein